MYALKYNTETTSKKDIGDIYVDGIPWNIKSNNINKSNYSPNLISADKLFNHLINGKFLKFLSERKRQSVIGYRNRTEN